MARRSDHTKEELQDLIIDETMKLVDDFGATNISARDIATRIGYAPGTLYTHFDNLEAIFLQVNLRSLERLEARIQDAKASAGDPAGRLLEMGKAYLGFAEAHPNWFALLFNQKLKQGQAVPPRLQEIVDGLFEMARADLGALAPDAAVDELEAGVGALWSAVHGICALSLADRVVTQRWRADRLVLKTLVTHFVASWSQTAAGRERSEGGRRIRVAAAGDQPDFRWRGQGLAGKSP